MSSFSVYGVCPCGWNVEAPFGSLFHIHREVCPKCGTSKDDWKVVTGQRVNDGSWWHPQWRVVPRDEP